MDVGDIASGKETGYAGFATMIDEDVTFFVQCSQVTHKLVVGEQAKFDKDALNGQRARFRIGGHQVEAGDKVIADDALNFPIMKERDFGVADKSLPQTRSHALS